MGTKDNSELIDKLTLEYLKAHNVFQKDIKEIADEYNKVYHQFTIDLKTPSK